MPEKVYAGMKRFFSKKGVKPFLLALALLFCIGAVAVRPILVKNRYHQALDQFEAGEYQAAYQTLGKVPETYQDTEQLLPYYKAYASFAQGDYAKAAQLFQSLAGYRDAPSMAQYAQAYDALEQKEYEKAHSLFDGLDHFENSADMTAECSYRMGNDLLEKARYDDAYQAFAAIDGYKDSGEKIKECRYQAAQARMEEQDYAGALEHLAATGDYKESKDLYKECKYQQAVQLAGAGDLDSLEQARQLLAGLDGYKDAKQQMESVQKAIEAANRVPYQAPAGTYFDVDCTNPADIRLKLYRGILSSNEQENTANIAQFSPPFSPQFAFSMYLNGFHSTTAPHLCTATSDPRFEYFKKEEIAGVTVYEGFDIGLASYIRVRDDVIRIDADEAEPIVELVQAISNGSQQESMGYIPAGAIVLNEYDYIPLHGFYFDTLHYYVDFVEMFTMEGTRLWVGSWQSGGSFAESYKGYDIYAKGGSRSGSAYCNVYPDVFVEIGAGNVAEAKRNLKTLIDGMQKAGD